MKMKTGKQITEYEVIDRSDVDTIYDKDIAMTYSFSNIKEATRWIQELLTEFGADARLITAYERQYDEFGNYVRSERFF